MMKHPLSWGLFLCLNLAQMTPHRFSKRVVNLQMQLHFHTNTHLKSEEKPLIELPLGSLNQTLWRHEKRDGVISKSKLVEIVLIPMKHKNPLTKEITMGNLRRNLELLKSKTNHHQLWRRCEIKVHNR